MYLIPLLPNLWFCEFTLQFWWYLLLFLTLKMLILPKYSGKNDFFGLVVFYSPGLGSFQWEDVYNCFSVCNEPPISTALTFFSSSLNSLNMMYLGSLPNFFVFLLDTYSTWISVSFMICGWFHACIYYFWKIHCYYLFKYFFFSILSSFPLGF